MRVETEQAIRLDEADLISETGAKRVVGSTGGSIAFPNSQISAERGMCWNFQKSNLLGIVGAACNGELRLVAACRRGRFSPNSVHRDPCNQSVDFGVVSRNLGPVLHEQLLPTDSGVCVCVSSSLSLPERVGFWLFGSRGGERTGQFW